MTYSWPHYEEVYVDIPRDFDLSDRPYKLLRFEELSVHSIHTVRTRKSKNLPGDSVVANEGNSLLGDALPILFIHGNAGHHAQVRSIAKEIQIRVNQVSTANYIAVYTIDFLEEMNFAHGDVLLRQTKYAELCVNEIYRLHGGRKVIVVGHSMGGIVGKYVAHKSEYQRRVHDVITLSSPHRSLPIYADPSVVQFYRMVAQHVQAITPPKHVASIHGGGRDYLIRPIMTQVQGVNKDWKSTLEMPGVGVTCDHDNIVWCNQVAGNFANLLIHMAQHPKRSPHIAFQQGWDLPATMSRKDTEVIAAMQNQQTQQTLVGCCVYRFEMEKDRDINLCWAQKEWLAKRYNKFVFELATNVRSSKVKVVRKLITGTTEDVSVSAVPFLTGINHAPSFAAHDAVLKTAAWLELQPSDQEVCFTILYDREIPAVRSAQGATPPSSPQPVFRGVVQIMDAPSLFQRQTVFDYVDVRYPYTMKLVLPSVRLSSPCEPLLEPALRVSLVTASLSESRWYFGPYTNRHIATYEYVWTQTTPIPSWAKRDSDFSLEAILFRDPLCPHTVKLNSESFLASW
eukprot:PhF_6_TR18893/c0_g1_i2/m.27528/K05294/PGAP1; glycosylphosphatidylinositol deacylase